MRERSGALSTPVLGFNNNVRYRGRLFHIQTEDSGVRFSRIVTHLFADGGRIIKTTRTDYTEHVEKPDVLTLVRQLMKEQHRAMFVSLREGELDAVLEQALGPLPETAEGGSGAGGPAGRRDGSRPGGRRKTISNPNLQGIEPAVPPPPAEAFDLEVKALSGVPSGTASRPPPRKSNPPRKSRPPAVPPRTAPQRPAAQFAHAPGSAARSIFGDGAISEQTLDEVILSYLAEDLDGEGHD